jgi:hypothetical protein
VSALTVVETALLVVALVYIVALLRSHADILRRLAALEGATDARASGRSAPRTPRSGATPARAAAIAGTTPAGDAVALSLDAGSPITLLAFLTSGCAACAPLWEGLHEPGRIVELADRVVVVTHDADRESPARLRDLAPPFVDVVMATAAWEDYAVPASPHFVLTDGTGGILGQGSALSWDQLSGMVADARADSEAVAGRSAPARSTAERAARSEQALARAGIGPGHPSLYPSDTTTDDGA